MTSGTFHDIVGAIRAHVDVGAYSWCILDGCCSFLVDQVIDAVTPTSKSYGWRSSSMARTTGRNSEVVKVR